MIIYVGIAMFVIALAIVGLGVATLIKYLRKKDNEEKV